MAHQQPPRALSNVIGVDDCPFARQHRGDVGIIGAVFAGLRFEGVIRGKIRRDGANAAKNIAQLIAASKFAEHIQLVMLQGIALGGFNVVDIFDLNQRLNLPVLVIARRAPDFAAIQQALRASVPGGVASGQSCGRV